MSATESLQQLLQLRSSTSDTAFAPESFATPTISRRKALYYSLQSKYKIEKVNSELNKLEIYCGLTSSFGRVRFMPALRVLEQIMYRTENRVLQQCDVEKMIVCSLALVNRAYSKASLFGRTPLFRLRRVKLAEMNYFRMVWLLTPEKAQEILTTLMNYLSEWKLWEIEMLCMNLIHKIVLCHVSLDSVLHMMLQSVESSMNVNWAESRCVLRVMHEILKFGSPRCSMVGMVNLAEKLLSWLYEAISAQSVSTVAKLHRGLEVCVRRLLERFDDDTLLDMILVMLEKLDSGLDDVQIVDFGSVIEYTVLLYRTGLYTKTLHRDLLHQLFLMMASVNRVISLTASRVLQRFLDRHNNLFSFVSPELYLENLSFNIVVGSFRNADKLFLLECREQLHHTLLQVVRLHGHTQVNLESVYSILALLVVEIPCGFTAAFVVCVAMDIQSEAQGLSENEIVAMSWRHAMVVGIMSLVCWAHHAATLYKYVETIISRRGRQAPHLNPPMKLKYAFASHHVLWQKPELFFEPWELRYALWKHFRCKNAMQMAN